MEQISEYDPERLAAIAEGIARAAKASDMPVGSRVSLTVAMDDLPPVGSLGTVIEAPEGWAVTVRWDAGTENSVACRYLRFVSAPESRRWQADMAFTCSGRVDLRDALAKIRRERPASAEITWVHNDRKSTTDLPLIEVPEGTILTITMFSGMPALRLGSGRVVFRACSVWGNAMEVAGGELHVRTDGDSRKVTIHVTRDAVDAKVTTSAVEVQEGSRLYVWDSRHRGDLASLVVQDDANGVPLAWMPAPLTGEFEIQGNYGQGWEMVTTESTPEAAQEQLRTYDTEEPHIPHRVRRVRAEGGESR